MGFWLERDEWRLAVLLLLLGGPVMAVTGYGYHQVFEDFRGGLYNAGAAIVHGRSPYRVGFIYRQAALMRTGHIAQGETSGTAFSVPVYPAPINVAMVPFALVPVWLAAGVYTVISAAAMIAGIRLLGVRDWRCLALVCVSWPFLYSICLGEVGPLLVLGTGIAWRWRDRLWPPALAIAGIVALKLFPWTLGAWLAITRRFRTLALSVCVCLVVTLGAWALIGFQGLTEYPRMLSDISLLQEGRGVSLVTVLVVAGASPTAATVAALIAALGILLLAWRQASGPDGDRKAFSLSVLAALTGTPIVWDHYMVLLFVPIALASPGLSSLWLVPVLTPVLAELTLSIVPNSTQVQAYSPNALRTAIPWLAIEALTAVYVLRGGNLRRRVARA